MTSAPAARGAVELRPAASLPMAELAALFTRVYSGYFVPVQVDEAGLREAAALFDLDLEASRLLVEDGAPAAFAFLGVRRDRGWIGGTGVVPERRGRGLGRAVLEAALAVARARGLAAVDLEVLVQNAPAIRIYEALGFRDVRVLDVWRRAPDAPPPPAAEGAVRALAAAECLARHPRYHDEPAPWQRDLATLRRTASAQQALAAGRGDEPEGWVLYRAASSLVRIADLALAPGAPPRSLAPALARLVADHPGAEMTLVNLPAADRAGEALSAAGFTVELRQREMRLALARTLHEPAAARPI